MSLHELHQGELSGEIPSFKYDVLKKIEHLLDYNAWLFADAKWLSEAERSRREMQQLKFIMNLTKLCLEDGPSKNFPAQKLIDLGLVPESGEIVIPRRIPETLLPEGEHEKSGTMLDARNLVSINSAPVGGGTEYSINELYFAITDIGYDSNGEPINYVIGTVQKNLCLTDFATHIGKRLETRRQDVRIVHRGRVFIPPPTQSAPANFSIPVTEKELRRTAAALTLAYAPRYPVELLL